MRECNFNSMQKLTPTDENERQRITERERRNLQALEYVAKSKEPFWKINIAEVMKEKIKAEEEEAKAKAANENELPVKK